MSSRHIRGPWKFNTYLEQTAAGNITVNNESVVMVNKTSGQATTVTLPAASSVDGRRAIIVVDGKGDAATNNITVVVAGSGTIAGASSFIIAENFGFQIFVDVGDEWQRLSASSGISGASTSIGASTAAAGTTTADAGVLPAGTAETYPTTAADDTKGVRIHATDKVTGRKLFIGNGVSNKILKVYAPSGGTINGAAADAAYSSASGKGVVIVCLSGSGNTWLAA